MLFEIGVPEIPFRVPRIFWFLLVNLLNNFGQRSFNAVGLEKHALCTEIRTAFFACLDSFCCAKIPNNVFRQEIFRSAIDFNALISKTECQCKQKTWARSSVILVSYKNTSLQKVLCQCKLGQVKSRLRVIWIFGIVRQSFGDFTVCHRLPASGKAGRYYCPGCLGYVVRRQQNIFHSVTQ